MTHGLSMMRRHMRMHCKGVAFEGLLTGLASALAVPAIDHQIDVVVGQLARKIFGITCDIFVIAAKVDDRLAGISPLDDPELDTLPSVFYLLLFWPCLCRARAWKVNQLVLQDIQQQCRHQISRQRQRCQFI